MSGTAFISIRYEINNPQVFQLPLLSGMNDLTCPCFISTLAMTVFFAFVSLGYFTFPSSKHGRFSFVLLR